MPAEVVLATLFHLWRTLQPLDVTCALMGGLALANWRHARFTKDVDVLVHLGDKDIDELVRVLTQAGFQAKRANPLVTIDDTQFIQLLYEPPESFVQVQVDLMLVSNHYQAEAIRRRVTIQESELGASIDVMACEDLIIHKLLAGRLIDLADCAALLRSNRSSLEIKYLTSWVNQLQLNTEFQQVWEEAFPGEKMPTGE